MLTGGQKETVGGQEFSPQNQQPIYHLHFQSLLKTVQLTPWKSQLFDSVKRYSLETYKLLQLTPKNVEKIYQKVSLKYKNNQGLRMNWHQNQLRLYIWFLAVSPGVFGIPTNTYGPEQLRQLALPFYGIHQDLCEYQFKSIIPTQTFRAWDGDEDSLLGEILKKHSLEGAWSNIAKQLFLLSGKRYFRTPQSCRERWQNHLDDRKVRGQWTPEQDLLLMKLILSDGKRWSVIAKKIGDTRTEHMVKNRFQTILRREFKSKKKPVRFSEQHQFCKDLVKRLSEKVTEQYSNSMVQDASSPHVSNEIQQDAVSQSLGKSKCPQTPSVMESPVLNPHHCPSFSSTFKPSYLSFTSIREEQSQYQSDMNVCNLYDLGGVGDGLFGLAGSPTLKCLFQKMETQLELDLEVPLFIDQTMFGSQQDQMVQYFFKESREFK